MKGSIRPKKCFGQNFLTDRNVINRIAAAVDPRPEDHILEIGPGRGALTSVLAASGATLAAVEVDRDLAALLSKQFAAQPVTIVNADVLETDLRSLLLPLHAGKWKVAANLPYNISSQILFLFLDNRDLVSGMTLMLQKEVGLRFAAEPSTKDYGILTVLFRLHFDVRMEFIVKPGSFFPVPAVDSAVLSFHPLAAPRVEVGDERYFRRVVKAAFSMRRKTLLNCLKSADLGLREGGLDEALSAAGIDGGRRGETLCLDEFAALTRELLSRRAA